jgi:hypothetical protein
MNIANSEDFFRHIVTKDFREFYSNSLDLRIAIHAAFSSYHMSSWYFADNFSKKKRVFNQELTKNDVGKFVFTLKEIYSPFGLLGDITNAYKHVKITRYEPATQTTSPVKIETLPCPEALFMGATFAMGDPGQAIVIKMKNENDIRLFKSNLCMTFELWKALLDNPEKPIDEAIAEVKDLFFHSFDMETPSDVDIDPSDQ